MINVDVLTRAGINYSAGLSRFMDDKELYETVLNAFVQDNLLPRARTAFDANDREALLHVVHEAKGSCGNADLTDVYEKACSLVRLLRSESYSDAELRESFLRFERSYITMQEAITEALKG